MSETTQSMKARLVQPTAAVDELYRELQVRHRCFPRWIEEGRVSRTDAQDRLDRIHTAHELLKGFVANEAKQQELASIAAQGR